MKRLIAAPLLVLLAIPTTAPAQSPAEMARTASLIESWQAADGGFGPSKGAKPALGPTSSAVRMLKNVGGSIPDVRLCREYVAKCFDRDSGGFAPEPGGKPGGCGVTASGLMAVAELDNATPEMLAAAVRYLNAEAKSFEDIRIAVAGLEAVRVGMPDVYNAAVKTAAPDFAQWTATVNEGRNTDGTWGQGADRARATGSRVAALLRMLAPLDHKDEIVAALKADQRPDGGWSRDGTDSDLETTYRVERSMFMMKAAPDVQKLRDYLARHRRDDGSYSSKPGADDAGGTYYCTTVERWARIQGGEPAIVETAGFTPLFDGKSLDGWEGDTSIWAAKDGRIVGTSRGLDHNEFLATTSSYRDFILKVTFRLRGEESANSGIQFRSVRIPGHEMSGYQADVGQNYWGCLYDESRRNKVLVQASDRAKAAIHRDGWNEYVIRCMGDHITLTLNGAPSVDYVEKDEMIARDGKIALQVHAGGPLTVEFKDIEIQPLPRPAADDADTPGFHLRSLKEGGRKYAVFLPNGFDASKTYPLILFLHGAGERGSDGITPTQAGIGPSIAKEPARFPAIVVFPQSRRTWAADSDDIKEALAALAEVESRYKTDRARTYLTGLSMGGHGTWNLGATSPDRFAAAAPVCGFGDPKWGDSLKGLPIWTFVGDADSPRIVGGTRALVEAVSKAGGSPRLTEYRGVGHNSWDRAYSDPRLMEWMLQQHR